MPDTPNNTSTTLTVTVDGAAVTDALDANGDHDWFAVTLVAGQSYTFFTSSTSGTNNTSTDTTLALRDASGKLIAFNDDYDNPPGQMSKIHFTATASGTYYLDVGGYNDADTGTYQVSAITAAPETLPVFTNDEIALQLTDGFWGDDPHRHDVAPGGTLDVIIDSLTAAGQSLARTALEFWTDATGILFNEVPTGSPADITFIDTKSGAYAETEWTDGIITSALVNISTAWISTYGTGFLNSYSLQSYVHEVGHALGLGHAGNYNGSAAYPGDALYANDGWPATVMSYFDGRSENSWFSDRGFTSQYTLTPMAADIIAAINLYGPRVGLTRTGDTTYGYNNTSGRDVFDPAVNKGAAVTIVDDGGVDTLDYSGTANAQQIYLEPELFSSVMGRTGNLVIARGTVIENAIGGGGSDIIIGNAANNVLLGGAGMDILYGEDGDDRLDGGTGNDEIDGGAGSDTIIASSGDDLYRGGSGGDTFVFGAVLAFLDAVVIADLGAGDVIDLNTDAGDAVQITSFIGSAAFSSSAGEYRYFWSGGETIVEYDGDGDGVPDGSLTIGNGQFTLELVTTSAGAHNLAIAGANTAPVLANPLTDQSSDEDMALSFNLPADAFSDADGDTLEWSATLADGTTLPGWLSFDAVTHSFSGTPPQDFNGDLAIAVTVTDGIAEASDTFTLTIAPVNDNPVAGDDSATTDQDTALAIAVASLLANDSDVDGGALTLSLPSLASVEGGTLSLAGGEVSYTPAPGFFGADSFTYVVEDGLGGSDTATVTVTVNAVVTPNIITGTPGNDVLIGTPGIDEIDALAGDDRLDGAEGADIMRGGAGDDTYYVRDDGDTVVELAGEGADFVEAYASFTLPDNVEIMRLHRTASYGAGNDLDNTINASPVRNAIELHGGGGNDNIRAGKYDDVVFGDDGNDTIFGDNGNDLLDGGAGDDRLTGGAGNDEMLGGADNDYLAGNRGDDVLHGGDGKDILIGSDGLDRLYGDAGIDLLRGGNDNDTLFGGDDRDQLYGDAGDDVLWGGAGQDFFTGGTGADLFMFDEPDLNGNSNGTADRIRDFSASQGDLIDLSAIDAVLGDADDAFTFIGDAAFSGTAGELRFQQYTGNYTALQMDTDGDGKADYAIVADGLIEFTASDFLL